jgi:hypothetical protein
MFTKVYEKIKEILRENYKSIIFLLVFTIIINANLPFYINATEPAGLWLQDKEVNIYG